MQQGGWGGLFSGKKCVHTLWKAPFYKVETITLCPEPEGIIHIIDALRA